VSTRASAWLAWTLAALCMAMLSANLALYVLVRTAEEAPGNWVTLGTVGDLFVFVPFLAFPLVGALIASRRPRNPIGWICLADGLLFLLLGVSDYYGLYGVARPGSVPFPVAVYALGQWLWVPAVGLLGIYLLLLFPDGKLPSKRWRPLAWLSGAVILLLSISVGLAPEPLQNLGGVRFRGAPLGGGFVLCCAAAVALVHRRLGFEPGVALPAFKGRGAPADKVDSFRRLGRGTVVSDWHNCHDHLRI
jgi:hypothetical protein